MMWTLNQYSYSYEHIHTHIFASYVFNDKSFFSSQFYRKSSISNKSRNYDVISDSSHIQLAVSHHNDVINFTLSVIITLQKTVQLENLKIKISTDFDRGDVISVDAYTFFNE